ncbi:lantibiotic dehydratase [Pedobacter sp. L105]|uniref:lantibiotic dehydratase n=1 Tax=Pedobacter sp. L105 TaxID=1641871 RepID=UPI00131B66C4|nr:lantibiotic dehydratase [Pedobacter sp. L105]
MGNTIKPFDFYLLRLPARSMGSLAELNQIKDHDIFVQEINKRYQSVELQEAIYLASPELHQELLKWLAGPAEDIEDKLLLTLYKYLIRMSSRATPYGLFSGYNTGNISNAVSELTLREKTLRDTRYTRLDMNYVAELVRYFSENEEIKVNLIFNVNNSLYRTGNTYRYYEYKLVNKKRHYYIVAIKKSKYILCILEKAKNGTSYQSLIDELLNMGLSVLDAKNYLDQVINAQILVSELEPTVTGEEFYKKLITILQRHNPEHPYIQWLLAIEAQLLNPADFVKTCTNIHHIIKANFPLSQMKDLVQTDLHIGMEKNNLNSNAVDILAQDITQLAVLSENKTPVRVQNFIKKFTERYEDQEIDLLEALDNEAGIGYDRVGAGANNHAPLISDLVFNHTDEAKTINWTKYRQLIFNKFLESSKNRGAHIDLTDADLLPLDTRRTNKIPSTFYLIGSFIAQNTNDLDHGDFKFDLSACCGPSALPLLGRFAQNDPLLAKKLKDCAGYEQDLSADTLIAEIVHLPDSRVGNILQRPQLRDYEIPFLGNSSLPSERQIPVTDLMISVKNNRVILRSKRLNKIVVPRLSSAHNYNGGIAVYKFLCDLQHQQGNFVINWDWGVLNDQPYLPRVEYKHIILTRARWKLTPDIYTEVNNIKSENELEVFLAKYRLPKRVVSIEGDKELLLDFSNPFGLRLLAQMVKKNTLILYEFMHEEHSLIVKGPQEDKFVNEVVIPFYAVEVSKEKSKNPTVNTPLLRRKFNLGSEWTYVKIYCGARWSEKILTAYILPLVTELSEKNLIQKWFFIRYHDPESHLRIRFLHPDHPDTMAQIIQSLNTGLKGLIGERIIQKIQYDTYNQELERYGTKTITFSESVFYHDSKAIINFLDLIEGEEGEYYRWLFAMTSIDRMLGDFNLNLDQKHDVVNKMQKAFFAEFNGNTALNQQLNNKYRLISKELNTFFTEENEELSEAISFFKVRSVENTSAYHHLKTQYEQEYPDEDLDAVLSELLPSFLHMSLNRIFVTKQRMHELVVYHYLTKYYQGCIARGKQVQLIKV